MKSVLHRSETRGYADHGWLKSFHTFSFADYHNPQRMQFGALRVLNDDCVAPGMGFGMHPHRDMEIISIPLEGELEHKDSMGNVDAIRKGDVQIMSTGTGIVHSEYNKRQDEEVKFLQIWIMPNQQGVIPRYDKLSLLDQRDNELICAVSPHKNDRCLCVQQDAWIFLGNFTQRTTVNYKLKNRGNGVYFFVLNGKVQVEGETLNNRDGFGVWEEQELIITADAESRLLMMEVPMKI